MAADVAVDLGTATTRIAVRGRGVVVDEPSVVAIRSGDAVAVGTEAREMLGRTPAGTRVVRPIHGGVVADFEATEHLLLHLLRKAAARTFLRPRVLVTIPAETTEVERRAVQDATRAAGAREVSLVAAPLAAAVGASLPILEPVGSMIVDLGAGHTEVAVISLGGLVVHRSVRVAGAAMDEAIASWLRSRRGLVVGEQTAEQIKWAVGSAVTPAKGEPQKVRGRDLVTGKPREVDVSGDDIAQAVAEPVARIRDAILDALAATPPELSADIVERGIIVCGGTSRLRGIDRFLREVTGLAIIQAENPERCTAMGAARLLEDPALQERVAAAT